MNVIGIDPGLDGGIGGVSGNLSFAAVLPSLNHRPDLTVIAMTLESFKPDLVVIEQVSIRPGQGGSSGLTIGTNYGMLLGLLHAKGIPFTEVRPQQWKRAMGLSKRDKEETPKESKERSIAEAQRLFPSIDFRRSQRATTYHDGMAEAVLIAEYGRRLGGK